MGGRSPQWSPLVTRDAGFFPTQELWISPLCGQLWCMGCLRDIQWVQFLGSDHPPQEGLLPGTPPHQRRRDNNLFLPSIPSHSWQAGMASLQLDGQSSLPNAGGPVHMLLLSLGDFSNVPAGIDGFGRQHKQPLVVQGAWRLSSSIHSSLILCGSQNKAHTSLARILCSSTSSTANDSAHQLGVSHLSALHGTHWLNSVTVRLQRHPITFILRGSH